MNDIIAAIDFSENNEGVLDKAAEIAKALGAKLWIVHATSIGNAAPIVALESYEYYGILQQYSQSAIDIEYDRKLTVDRFKHEHGALKALSAKFKEDGIDCTGLLLEGKPAEVILNKAADIDAGLIVLGSHGHGELHKLFLGSTSKAILDGAKCGVLIMPSSKG